MQSRSRENIAGALAAIIQAVPSEPDRLAALSRLLVFVDRDYAARSQASIGLENAEHIREVKLATLNQLVAIGRSSQTPEDVTIDLDAQDDIASNTAWVSIHGAITQMLGNILRGSMYDGEIFETTCDVLRTGYKERSAGPFVFPPSVTVDLLTSSSPSNPRADVAIRTAAAYISSNNSKSDRIAAVMPQLLSWLCGLASPNTEESDTPLDPDVVHAIIDFISRLIPKHLRYFAGVQAINVQMLFQLSISALDGAELLPKKAAAGLWQDLLSIPPTSSNAPFVVQLLRSLGSQLVYALVFGFGGRGSRSHLDWLAQPYRKLVAKASRESMPDVNWKMWTEAALVDPQFPGNSRVGDNEKKRFVTQVEQLRGDGRTVAVVKDFWLVCKGAPIAYG